MRKCFPGTINGGRFFLSIVACLSTIAIVACSKTAAPPPAPGPVFKLPLAGAVTDTSLRIGDSFPEIQTVDLDGHAITIDRRLLGDRYTLVIFWSTWCGFCMQELPHEVELAKRYEQDGLRVIGVNADETIVVAKAAATENQVTWLNVFEGPEKLISNQLGIVKWPALLILDSDGKVITATQQLRSIAAETLPDGSVRSVTGLDWALKKLLDNK